MTQMPLIFIRLGVLIIKINNFLFSQVFCVDNPTINGII